MNTEVHEYVERPKVARAVQWDCRNYEQIKSFCNDSVFIEVRGDSLLATVRQFDGSDCVLNYGDYVIEKEDGKFVCMKKRDFENNYEKVKYGY